jgi:hypothetical protein
MKQNLAAPVRRVRGVLGVHALFRAARLALKIAACRKFDLGGITCDYARDAFPQVSAPRFAFRHRLREGVFDAHDHGHAGTKLRYRQFLPRYFNVFIDAEPLICDCEKVEEGMPALEDKRGCQRCLTVQATTNIW